MGDATYSKNDRIRKRTDYLELAHTGDKVHTPHFIVVFRPNTKGRSRLGITVTAKVGKAVIRNRIKRHTREFFRLHRHEITGCWDINIIAKHAAANFKTGRDVYDALQTVFDRLQEFDKSKG